MIRIDRDGPGPPPAALLGPLLRAVREAAADADAVLVSDYGLGLLARPVLETVLRIAAQGKIVCADARYGLSQYRGVTVAKPNEVELEHAVGRPLGGDLAVLEEAGREMLRTLRAGSLLVTRGRSGMVLLRPGAPTAVLPVHGSPTAVDVTGAGDTVMAANTAALAVGAEPIAAARLANVAGALVVQKPGTATVTIAELRRELSRAEIAHPELLDASQETARRRKARR
jgi:rfaE bifunctional protein kinase chain/domain